MSVIVINFVKMVVFLNLLLFPYQKKRKEKSLNLGENDLDLKRKNCDSIVLC